ncbi:MAG: hypothetical protein U0452_12485 [Anaerolineae bacterium]
MIYKVSYVVLGGQHPGAIRNEPNRPETGKRIRLGRREFEIVEVSSLLPPRDEIQYLHATLREVPATSASK